MWAQKYTCNEQIKEMRDEKVQTKKYQGEEKEKKEGEKGELMWRS